MSDERNCVDDARLERMRGLAAEAGLREMAAAIVELRFLRGLYSRETIEQQLVSALRAAIHDNGPITEDKVEGAAKRIVDGLLKRVGG